MSQPITRARRGGAAGVLVVLITLVIILVVVFMNVGGSGSYAEKLSDTRKQGQELNVQINTDQLKTMILQFKLTNDRLPKDVAELEAGPGAFKDPWGNPITFTYGEQAGAGPQAVTFRSAGRDGEEGTEDDIVINDTLPL